MKKSIIESTNETTVLLTVFKMEEETSMEDFSEESSEDSIPETETVQNESQSKNPDTKTKPKTEITAETVPVDANPGSVADQPWSRLNVDKHVDNYVDNFNQPHLKYLEMCVILSTWKSHRAKAT